MSQSSYGRWSSVKGSWSDLSRCNDKYRKAPGAAQLQWQTGCTLGDEQPVQAGRIPDHAMCLEAALLCEEGHPAGF